MTALIDQNTNFYYEHVFKFCHDKFEQCCYSLNHNFIPENIYTAIDFVRALVSY